MNEKKREWYKVGQWLFYYNTTRLGLSAEEKQDESVTRLNRKRATQYHVSDSIYILGPASQNLRNHFFSLTGMDGIKFLHLAHHTSQNQGFDHWKLSKSHALAHRDKDE
jgi:hypothetical protein